MTESDVIRVVTAMEVTYVPVAMRTRSRMRVGFAKLGIPVPFLWDVDSHA